MLAGRRRAKAQQPAGGTGGVQQLLEKRLGKGAFRAIVICSGVLCYPLMAYGALAKAAARAAGAAAGVLGD